MYKKATHPCVMGRGNIKSDVLVLGEALGSEENRLGLPFVGKSGKLMQHAINTNNLDCYISNAVKCRPIDEKGSNRTPTPTEIDCCRPFTTELILQMKPKVILAVGRIPMAQLLKLNLSMDVARGKPFYHSIFDTTVIPTYHPSYVQRTEDRRDFNNFMNDVKFAKEFAKKTKARRIESTPVTLKDPLDIENYLNKLVTVPAFAFDLETTGLNIRTDKITDISLCCETGKGVHIEWKRIAENASYLDLLRHVLQSKAEKIAHNADFDVRFLQSIGLTVANPLFDTMLAYHTISMSYEGGKTASLYKLKTMAWLFTQEGGYESVLDPFGGIKGIQQAQQQAIVQSASANNSLFTQEEMAQILEVDFDLDARLLKSSTYEEDIRNEKLKKLNLTPKEYYSAMDADVTYRAYKYLKLRIDERYAYPFYNITMPLCRTTMRLHDNGIKLDIPYIDKLIVENNAEAEEIKEKFFKKIGRKININSTMQLRDVMYNQLGLKLPANSFKLRTKKSKLPSTDEAAIEYFSKQKPVLKYILDYRGKQKETSTYLEGFKSLADKGARIYPEYQLTGTATGRSSARNPNLQNIPTDNRIRNMVIPSKGNKLLVFDLSQIELRVLALLANDQNMIHAFMSGHDFHTYTACIMFNILIATFDKENNPDHALKRSMAKATNFGLIYQSTVASLAEKVGVSIEKAQNFTNKFYESYPKVYIWIQNTKAFAKHHGYVETLYGRRRYLYDIYSSNEAVRTGAERQAVNTPVQGSAGDIFFIGFNRIQDQLDKMKASSLLVGTVHDSAIIDACPEEIDELVRVVPDLMTKNIPRVPIELKVDTQIMDKWVK